MDPRVSAEVAGQAYRYGPVANTGDVVLELVNELGRAGEPALWTDKGM
jgi:hypothetical protein